MTSQNVVAIIAVGLLFVSFGIAMTDYIKPTRGPTDLTVLNNNEWYCSDVRIDSLRLPLNPTCHEYKRIKTEEVKP